MSSFGHETDPLLQKKYECSKTEPLNPSGELSFSGSVLVLFCTAVGAGIVVVPRALSFSGWAAGTLALIISAALSALSLSCLFTCAQLERGPSTYQSLVQKYLPTGLGVFVEVAVCVLLLGTIGTMLLLATHVWENIEVAMDVSPLTQNQMPWALLVVAVLLCLPRNFSQLEAVSLVNLFATVSVVLIISFESAQFIMGAQTSRSISVPRSAAGFSPCTSASGVLAAFPIALYSFFCQFQAPQLYSEMQPAHQRNASRIGSIAVAAMFSVYASVGLLGYAAFGADTDSDILAQLSKVNPTNRMLSVGHMLFGCVLLLSTPLVLAPLRSMILRRLAQNVGDFVESQDVSFSVHVATTASIVSLALLIALNVPGVDFIMGLLGATCVVFLALVVPGLLTLRCCGAEWKIEGCTLLTAGLICTPLTFGTFVAHHLGYLP